MDSVTAEGVAGVPAARARLTVYTVLVGPKEPLNDPFDGLPADATSDLDLDFVCLTDNLDRQSRAWRFERLPGGHLPPEKLSRRPKAMPHAYFPEATHSLYVDNTVTFKRLPQASDLQTDQPYLFRAFRHPARSTMAEETDAVAMLGYDEVATLCRQLDFYAAATSLDSLTPLTTATVLLRSHHDATVSRFGTLWWESVLAFSKRDQLSIDFALQLSGARIDYWPGATHDNPFIHWRGSLGPRRVKANFDETRYAWTHRDDPEAQRDPRAHFLAQGTGDDARYQRRVPILEYICHRHHSSLGSTISPRRHMADALDDALPRVGSGAVRYLIVCVSGSTGAGAFSDDELGDARRVLGVRLGREAVGTLLNLQAAELDTLGTVYTAGPQALELVLVLGAQGEHVAAAVQKLMRLLSPERGTVLMALASPASLQQAQQAEALLTGQVGQPVHTALSGSRHDDVRGCLDNTVLGFSYPAPASRA